MKKSLIYLLCLLFSLRAYTQDLPPVEVHLTLMENISSKGLRELSIGVSVINNTGHDIYIPGLAFGSIEDFEIYDLTSPTSKKVDLYPGTYSDTATINGTMAFTEKAIMHTELDVQFQHIARKHNAYQDSVKESLHLDKWLTDRGNDPLFLKAGESWQDHTVRDMSIILVKKATYKICHEPQHLDHQKFPKKIGTYQVYFQENIQSNTIYYCNMKTQKDPNSNDESENE